MVDQTLGGRISQLRKDRAITQEKLAETLGVSSQAVSKWENDIACPDIMLLPQLAELLGVSVDQLLTGKKEQPVKLPPEGEKKPWEEMIFRLSVLSAQGDKVRLNLPIPLLRMAIETDIISSFGGGDALSKIDFSQIMKFVEQGVVGKILEVESADVGTVEIWVPPAVERPGAILQIKNKRTNSDLQQFI